MTPDQFFENFVRGNYDDFEEHPDCVRRGFNAAIAVSHMADQYLKFFRKNDPAKVSQFRTIGEYVEYVSKRTDGCFRDIRSIANVFKHLYLDNEYAVIASTGAIELLPVIDENIAEISAARSDARNEYTVVFRRKTGEQSELLPVLKHVVDFWSEEIRRGNGTIPIIGSPCAVANATRKR